jgi:hypothetical protein
MAASWSTARDPVSWKQSVTAQLVSASFASRLTHGLLVKLYDAARRDTAVKNVTEVLELIPSSLAVAAAERQAAVDGRGRVTCTRCHNHVTEWLMHNDPVGCVVFTHPGSRHYNTVIGANLYTCCKSKNNQGCTQSHHNTHTIL